MAKKTALYEKHVKYGGTIVDFAGYELPVQYESGIIAEHLAVRKQAGLFDVSHMGELLISGKDAEVALNALLSNDIRGMYDGQVRYSLLPNENGGAVDDVLVYRINGEAFLVVVNASNADKDAAFVESHLKGNVKFENLSDRIAQLALQGPLSERILLKLVDKSDIPVKYYSFIERINVAGIECLISRTGYTGEAGFELYCANEDAPALYEILLEAGKEDGLIPAGLGARDTLRLEAAMPLYGHELGEDIPINEVGLSFAIKMGKDEFTGKAALEKHVPTYKRVGAEVEGRGIVREHTAVTVNGEEVGYVTSGTYSPSLGKGIAMLRIKADAPLEGLTANVRGRELKLKTVTLPFDYKNK